MNDKDDKDLKLAIMKYYVAKSKANTESLLVLMIAGSVIALFCIGSALYYTF